MTLHPHEPSRLQLAQLPTPVVELKNLAADLAADLGADRILLKRDDLTGLELTGNKVRKLEYVVADALAQGADTLVTHGGFQSNHCRATAAIGARLGLRVRLILRSAPNPEVDGNLFLDRLFGADVTYHAPDEYNTMRQAIVEEAIAAERAAGRKPYFFPVGASVPLGTWGYIRCFRELLDQLGPDAKVDVFTAVSSSGTHAGLIIGRALLGGADWRIIGVPVSDSLDYFRTDLRRLVDETSRQFNLGLSEQQTPIELLDGYIGEGYAIPTAESLETLALLARREGTLLDPTYTAKAMTGFIDAIKKGVVRDGATPLFIHTGGAFGLMARRDLFV